MPYWGFQCPSASKDLPLLEQVSGRHVSIAGMYQSAQAGSSTYAAFPKAEMDKIAAYGAKPMLTWQLRDSKADPKASPAWSYASIMSGAQDLYLTSYLTEWGKLPYPTYGRWLHELDGDWYPWGLLGGINGNTPDLHKQVWNKLCALAAKYAPLVEPVWCPDSYNLTNNAMLDAAFPGAANVRWVGCDAYNFGSFGPHGWRSAATMFDRTMAWYAKVAPTKPVVICEFGCAEDPASGDKGAWLANAATTLAAYPQLKAAIYMHDTAAGGRINRLDSSAGATTAWQTSFASHWSAGAECVTLADSKGTATRYVPIIA